MNKSIIYCLFALAFTLSCSLKQTELPSKTRESSTQATRGERQNPPPPLVVKDKLLFPTTLHPNDQTIMVLINAGEKPQSHSPIVQPFYIDQYEITVKKFSAFSPKYSEKPYTGNRICPNCPAMGIDWFSADKYCRWAGKRLPSETEWDFAAQGPAGYLWPWGNQFLPRHANLEGDDDGYTLASPVGSFPQGSSPYGVQDMIGNVWEWVSNSETTDPKKVQRIIKGGGWTTSLQTTSFRAIVDPTLKNPFFGFRCSKSIN
ncbi:MAG: hypothetical protein A3K09_00270 [Nitrospinae bacterium RIFCSPLOWO2_12_FULL_47_7]|nr:MAG: hypothetical protein A3K09_00270 [Nitrospinae bacterium RIFCSPLOWO2_12_FULL_47_7]